MNIFTAYRNHARLADDMFSDYTEERAAKFLESTLEIDKIRVPLRTAVAPLMGAVAVALVAYIVLRTGTGHAVTFVEVLAPGLAMLLTVALYRLNENVRSQYWREATAKVESAKAVRELLHRPNHD